MSRMIYLLSPVTYKETVSLPMIEFSLLYKEIDFSSYDMLMFTSKQAVKSAEMLNPEWKKIPCLAIGKATAEQIRVLGGEVVYAPENFYAKSLNDVIVTSFQQKKILYLRPKKVSFDSKKYLLSHGVVLDEEIIYETTCITYDAIQKPKEHAVIIFTSPSTIECFFKNFDWDSSYRAVVIGSETKKHLPPYVAVEVASLPRIEACIAKAKEILLSSNSK